MCNEQTSELRGQRQLRQEGTVCVLIVDYNCVNLIELIQYFNTLKKNWVIYKELID